MSKFTELLESTLVRYQRTAFLPGDLVRFKKNWQKSDFAQANQDYAKKIQSFIESGNNIRLSITKPANPGVNGSFGNYEQQHDVFGDITLETAPGLYADFMTIPLELIEVVPLDNSLAPIPDKWKKKDPTQIKPSEYKSAKAGKTTAKDPSNQDVETDNLERQTGSGEAGDRKLNYKNVKIPGGKKWDDKKPGGRKNDWAKLKESTSLIQNDATLIFEAYMDSNNVVEEAAGVEPHAKYARYGWIIDSADAVTGNPHRVGITGPRNIDPAIEERLKRGEGEKFQMLCDGETVASFTGRYLGPKDEHMFAPKDDLGEPDCGCTEIHYLKNGTWQII